MRRVLLCAGLVLSDVLRRPLVVPLLLLIPALFQAVVMATTRSRHSYVLLAALHLTGPDAGFRSLDERTLALVFLGLAAVSFSVAFVAFYMVHGRLDCDRRLVAAGVRASELAVVKGLVLALLAGLLAAYETGLLCAFTELERPLGVLCAIWASALTYGCIGLALGACVRNELQGILVLVLLANIDIGWLQNPAYYGGSRGRWLIESLPGFWPTQLSVLRATTLDDASGVTLRTAAVVVVAAVGALLVIGHRLRRAASRSELARRLLVTAVTYALWLASFEAVGRYACTLPTHDLSLPIDAAIPFWPSFVWVYELTYVLPLTALFAIEDGHRFNRAVFSIGLASLGAYVVYLALPVAFAWPELGGSLAERVLAVERRHAFPPGANHLPSLHVANAFILYCAVRGQRLGRLGDRAALALAFAIMASTLFVKQHIFVDALAGSLWGPCAWLLVGAAYRRRVDENAPPAVALLQALLGNAAATPAPAPPPRPARLLRRSPRAPSTSRSVPARWPWS